MDAPLRVLIVEDSESDAGLLLRALRRAGYDVDHRRVETEATLRQALRDESWDMIVSDYHLPQLDAPAAMRVFKDSGLDIPFIVVSGTIGEEVAVTMMKEGAHDYVMKNNLTRFALAAKRELQEAEQRRQRRQAEQARRELEQERNRLLEQLKEENEDLEALTRVTANAISTLEIDQLLGVLLERVAEVMKADVAVILLAEEGRLRIGAARGIEAAAWEGFSLTADSDIAGQIAAAREPLYLEDAQTDARMPGAPFKRNGVRSVLTMPLRRNGVLVGVLTLGWLVVHPYRAREAHLLRITAERCASAILNATLYEQSRRAEVALRESEATLRSLFDSASLMLGIVQIEGEDIRRISVNAETYRFFGRQPGSMHGRLTSEFSANLDQTRVWVERYLASARAGGPLRFEYQQERGGETRWLAATLCPIAGTQDRFAYAVEDVTDLKRAQEERERLRTTLFQAQKLEAVGTLAGGVAHDFNNILTAIMGYTGLALRDLDKASPLYNDLTEIQRAADRASNLTRQLLLFSQKQPIQFAPLNLNRVVEGVLNMLKRLIGENIQIRTQLEPDLWVMQADAGTLEQILMNLAVNARDAMPAGGSLAIHTENVTLGAVEAAAMPDGRAGRFVRLRVTDSGVGMSAETQSRIFEPFFTTKGPGKGTGLGLSVVHGIVKRHQGWITVDSAPGRGATLAIYLPAEADALAVAGGGRALSSPVSAGRGHGERVLLVEDDADIRRVPARMLRASGYVVVEAASAEDAMRIFEQEPVRFDLLFTDFLLPGKSGLELAQQLRARQPALPVLLSSGYTDNRVDPTQLREWGYHVLPKPYTLEELQRSVAGLLQTR